MSSRAGRWRTTREAKGASCDWRGGARDEDGGEGYEAYPAPAQSQSVKNASHGSSIMVGSDGDVGVAGRHRLAASRLLLAPSSPVRGVLSPCRSDDVPF